MRRPDKDDVKPETSVSNGYGATKRPVCRDGPSSANGCGTGDGGSESAWPYGGP